MESKIISCEFNIDTASVEVKYADGSMLSSTAPRLRMCLPRICLSGQS